MLRHCATSRKVAGSIPDVVIGNDEKYQLDATIMIYYHK